MFETFKEKDMDSWIYFFKSSFSLSNVHQMFQFFWIIVYFTWRVPCFQTIKKKFINVPFCILFGIKEMEFIAFIIWWIECVHTKRFFFHSSTWILLSLAKWLNILLYPTQLPYSLFHHPGFPMYVACHDSSKEKATLFIKRFVRATVNQHRPVHPSTIQWVARYNSVVDEPQLS
jgi:hypothetical protein